MNMETTSVDTRYRDAAEAALHAGDLRTAPERMLTAVAKIFVQDADTYQYGEVKNVVESLDDIGFFRFRNAVHDLADTLGVSRVTVYKHLNNRGVVDQLKR